MTKDGVTLEDVRNAAGDIERRLGPGAVTLRGVRGALGRGSLQTIQRHLVALREEQVITPVAPLRDKADEISLSAREQGISFAKWIEQAITEKLQRDRIDQLQDALSEPKSWTARRRQALGRLTAEAGTRSPDAPSQENVLDALRATIRQDTKGAMLARRIIADGHPHDLYLIARGERNVETLLDSIVELEPKARPVAVKIGMELKLGGEFMRRWLGPATDRKAVA